MRFHVQLLVNYGRYPSAGRTRPDGAACESHQRWGRISRSGLRARCFDEKRKSPSFAITQSKRGTSALEDRSLREADGGVLACVAPVSFVKAIITQRSSFAIAYYLRSKSSCCIREMIRRGRGEFLVAYPAHNISSKIARRRQRVVVAAIIKALGERPF